MQSAGLGFHFAKILKADFIQKCRQVTQIAFNKYLLLTNVGISATLSCSGDTLQQHYEVISKKERQWDKSRTLRMTISGIAVGIVCHFWYQFLDKRFPGRALKTVMKKVLIDQFVLSPCYITVFFATTCYMEEKNWEDFKKELVQKWWRLYVAEWIIWPPAQVINFYWLPPKYRVLYDNTISLGYDVYTSYVKYEIPMEEESNENSDDP